MYKIKILLHFVNYAIFLATKFSVVSNDTSNPKEYMCNAYSLESHIQQVRLSNTN